MAVAALNLETRRSEVPWTCIYIASGTRPSSAYPVRRDLGGAGRLPTRTRAMPPDPASRPDAGSRSGVPAGIPEPPKKTREINWTAVGSVAAVAAALIAFLAYALPSGGPTPDPATTRQSQSGATSTALSTESTSAPATASPVSSFSAPAIAQSSGPPAGCQQAYAAIMTFNKLNGPTNRVAVAAQAAQQVGAAYQTSESSGDSSAVSSDLYALDQDFGHLEDVALVNDGSQYNMVLAQTDKDIQTLNTDCGAG
jgi:hypothetical protein